MSKKYTLNLKESNYKFTEREKDVLKYLIKGKTNREIAIELNVTVHTVKANIATILQKLVVRDRTQAVIKVLSEKLVDI